MKNLSFNTKFALVSYKIAILEKYDFRVINEDDDFDYLEEMMQEFNEDAMPLTGHTIFTKDRDGSIIDYYTGCNFNDFTGILYQ